MFHSKYSAITQRLPMWNCRWWLNAACFRPNAELDEGSP
jgi:hypothetical protein